MSKLKILHTADVHLGSKFYFLEDYAQKREEDFLNTFGRICNLAISEKVDLILIAGDLFDSPHPPTTIVQEVKKQFEKLTQNNIAIALIAGTHDDIIASDSVYHEPYWNQFIFLKDPILEKPKFMNIKGIPLFLYGVSYNTLDFKDPLPFLQRKDEKGLHLGLLHCSLQDSPEWKIMSKDLPCTTNDLFKLKLDYLALGHYHNHRVYEQEGKFISYCGSPEGKRFHETGERFVNIIHFENNKVTVQKKEVQTKKMESFSIDLTTISDEKHLIQTIQTHGTNETLSKITLLGCCEFTLNMPSLFEKCFPHFAYLKIDDETEVLQSLPIHNIQGENTIRGLFIRMMREKIQKDPEREKIYHAAIKEAMFYFSKDKNVL